MNFYVSTNLITTLANNLIS